MKIALCNEVLQPMAFAAQCEMAARLGYDALEVAPFTLAEVPHLLSPQARAATRRAAQDAGVAITSLHWLLVAPKGLSITSPDEAVRARTLDVMRRLIDLCHDVGGRVMVHGSPAQRAIHPGETAETARARARDCFARAAEHAAEAGIVYCVEPLSRKETLLINSIAEAVALVDEIGNPALRTMIDTSAASQTESESIAALIDRWLPSGRTAHIQVNDKNRRGPGQGDDRFAAAFAALNRHRYAGTVAVEPFEYVPDGPTAAARAIGYIRGIIETLEGR